MRAVVPKENLSQDHERKRYIEGGKVMSVKFRVISALCMSFCMSLLMSFIMAVINVGVGSLLVSAWIRGWGIGFIVALPLAYILPPFIQKLLRNRGLK